MTTTSIASLSGLIGIATDGTIKYCSKGLLQLFGHENESIGSAHELFKGYPFLLDLLQSLYTFSSNSIEAKIKGGNYLVEAQKDKEFIEGAEWVMSFTNVDVLINRENKLQLENNKLLESNKELEYFAYVTSHDLNEPLRMVSNFAHLLDEEYRASMDESATTYIRFIIEGSKKVQYLINDLLAYNRAFRAELNPEWIQGEDVILLQGYYLKDLIEEKNAELSIKSNERIHADPKLLGQVFYHIIKNGIQYNESPNPQIQISFKEREQDFLVSITDNGIGIDHEHHDEVFKILKRINTRPDLSGSGVGLAVCKKLVNLHSGKIWFESKINSGTTFHFTLGKNIPL